MDLIASIERMPRARRDRVCHDPQPGRRWEGPEPGHRCATAWRCTRLHVRAALVKTRLGDELLGVMESEGIDPTGVTRVSAPTGVALITVDAQAENTIVVATGGELSPRS